MSKEIKRRNFKAEDKEQALIRQGNCCALCGADLRVTGYHADHWDGDKSNDKPENCRMLCPTCNISKSDDKVDEHKRLTVYAMGELKKVIEKGLSKEISGSHAKEINDAIDTLLKVSYRLYVVPRGIEYISKSADEITREAEVELYKKVFMSAYREGVRDGMKLAEEKKE